MYQVHYFYRIQTECDFINSLSGELSALQLVAEEFYDQDINTILNEDTLCTALTRATNDGSFLHEIRRPDTHQCSNITLLSILWAGFGVIVNALLQWPGIDINAQEMNGNTALHYAAKLGDLLFGTVYGVF
jgi:hypothetical protein